MFFFVFVIFESILQAVSNETCAHPPADGGAGGAGVEGWGGGDQGAAAGARRYLRALRGGRPPVVRESC